MYGVTKVQRPNLLAAVLKMSRLNGDRQVTPHLRLNLVQFALAVGHYFNDVVQCITVATLELNTQKLHVSVNTVQSFHL